jgi:hypothetical protein
MGFKRRILAGVQEFKLLVKFQDTSRKWHIPLLATICMGVPILLGLYFGNVKAGITGGLSAFVILYLPVQGSFTNKITTIAICAFGLMVSYSAGQLFSFSKVSAVIVFGVFSVVVHWTILYYKTAPPRSFFFIVVASISICQPFNVSSIPSNIGFIALGTIFSCTLAFLFVIVQSVRTNSKEQPEIIPVLKKNPYADFWEAIIMGGFMMTSLTLGYILEFDNPYWIPISCAAVMQGASRYIIWQRTIQRIAGTFIGLGLCWLLITVGNSTFLLCMYIILLQFIVEALVVRNYALAVIFITPLTLFLSEVGNPGVGISNDLITLRFWEILIGSALGALGGWILHREQLRYAAIKGIKIINTKFDLRNGKNTITQQ